MYAAAAAALVFLGWLAFFPSTDDMVNSSDFDMSLDFIEQEETDPLLADDPSFYEWEAGTDILIQEFDE